MTQGMSQSPNNGGFLSSSRPTTPLFYLRPRRHTDSEGSTSPPSTEPRAGNNFFDLTKHKIIHSRSASTLVDRTRPRTSHTRSHSNLVDSTSSSRRHFQIDSLEHHLDGRARRSELAELIDFLRNQAPPADNFMSIPEEERGRKSKLGFISKRSKSVPRSTRHIQLPDSAVSGVTIGGHRHIAISIPLEASPLGDTPRSQYPVFGSESGGPQGGLFRYTNDKGVVTVLRTVPEDRESMIATGLRGNQYPNFHRPGVPLSRSGSNSRPSSSSSYQRAGSKPHNQDYYGLFPKSWDRPLPLPLGDSRIARTLSAGQRTRSAGGLPATSTAQGLYPTRTASMTYRSSQQQPSIDGVISQQPNLAGHPPSRAGSTRSNRRSTGASSLAPRKSMTESTNAARRSVAESTVSARRSVAESNLSVRRSFAESTASARKSAADSTLSARRSYADSTTGASSARKSMTESIASWDSTPLLMRCDSSDYLPAAALNGVAMRDQGAQTSDCSDTKSIVENSPEPPKESSPATLKPTLSRREKVRERKLRDIEAARAAREKLASRGSDRPATSPGQSSGLVGGDKLTSFQPTLSPIIIVADIEPCPVTPPDTPLTFPRSKRRSNGTRRRGHPERTEQWVERLAASHLEGYRDSASTSDNTPGSLVIPEFPLPNRNSQTFCDSEGRQVVVPDPQELRAVLRELRSSSAAPSRRRTRDPHSMDFHNQVVPSMSL